MAPLLSVTSVTAVNPEDFIQLGDERGAARGPERVELRADEGGHPEVQHVHDDEVRVHARDLRRQTPAAYLFVAPH